MKQNKAPRKNEALRYTQNFLKDKKLVDKIVNLGNIGAGSTVLEIGPGDGIITVRLAEQVTRDGRVIAIELDSYLASKLTSLVRAMPQIEIVNTDIRQFPLGNIPQDYLVFSNIPFNITSELLELLFDPTHGPNRAYLILQQDSIIELNRHGIKTETFKSLLVKPFYEINLIYPFSRSDFSPQPSVEAALFSFERRSEPLINRAEYGVYKDFLAFASKDRVGEGVWKKTFSKRQLDTLIEQTGLIDGRGLKSQSISAIVAAFRVFVSSGEEKRKIIADSMTNLREEQKRREQINQAGGHHRTNKTRRNRESK